MMPCTYRFALTLFMAAMLMAIGCSDDPPEEITPTVQTPPESTDTFPDTSSPVVQKVDTAQQLETKQQQLTTIGRALLNYHETHGEFPAANTDFKGEHKGLSWRVHLLPFVENTRLYEQFHLDESWDSPHNKSLISNMPDIFKTPEVTDPTRTAFQVYVGPQMAFQNDRGLKITTFTDGTSNVGVVVETDPAQAEAWTKPGGLALDEKQPLKSLGQPYPYGFLFLMGDTQVNTFDVNFLKDGNLKKILTRNGLEVIKFPRTKKKAKTEKTKDESPPPDEDLSGKKIN